MNQLFGGDLGRINDMKVIRVKVRGNPLLPDAVLRAFFLWTVAIFTASAWMLPAIERWWIVVPLLMPLGLVWIGERAIQRRQADEFAEALAPQGEDTEEFPWASVHSAKGSQIAANFFARDLLKDVQRQSFLVKLLSACTSSIPRK